MMLLFILYASFLSVIMAGMIILLRKYAHGTYNGVWYILASCVYFCLIFLGAVYILDVSL